MKPLLIAAAVASTLVAGLGGCMSVTPYQPRVPGARVGGYSEEKIDALHWRVRFSGNSATSRDTVERYLLYRAAELTLQQGGEWFEEQGANTEARTRFELERDSFYDRGPGRDYGWGWRPDWSYYGPNAGWRHWLPSDQDKVWTEHYELKKITRYVATAEIRIGTGDMPASDRMFDARQVIGQLGGGIQRPPAG